MRRSLLLLSLLFVFSKSMAQINAEHLQGVWSFIGSSSGGTLSDKNKHLLTYKMISNDVITTIILDTVTRKVVSTVLGGYMVNPPKGIGHYKDLSPDSCVISEFYWANDSLTNTVAFERVWSGIKIENHDIMYQTVVGSKDRQTWMRDNNYKLNYLYENILGQKDTVKYLPTLPLKEFNEKTLFVLKSKTRSVFVKPNKDFPKPFWFMKNDTREEPIEGLLHSGALDEYGQKARYGAIVIWATEAYYDKALKTLKAQKNVL